MVAFVHLLSVSPSTGETPAVPGGRPRCHGISSVFHFKFHCKMEIFFLKLGMERAEAHDSLQKSLKTPE